jgi:valyl-tRNA synthetase
MRTLTKKIKREVKQFKSHLGVDIQVRNISKIRSIKEEAEINPKSMVKLELKEAELTKVAKKIHDLMIVANQSEIIQFGREEVSKATFNLLFKITEYNPRKEKLVYALGINHKAFKSNRMLQKIKFPGKKIKNSKNFNF